MHPLFRPVICAPQAGCFLLVHVGKIAVVSGKVVVPRRVDAVVATSHPSFLDCDARGDTHCRHER